MRILLTIVLASSVLTSLATEIRVRNDANIDFVNVIVGKDTKFGDIKRGEVSGYRRWNGAPPYVNISATASGKRMRFVPDDYFGARPLGEGRFTYVVTIHEGRLTMRTENDKK